MNSSHVTYNVNTVTTNEAYKYSQSVVVRRYSDFLWLHDILAEEYPYAVIPPMPQKNALNRFEIDFVEERRNALQYFIRSVCASPLLKDSKRVRSFLTSDDEKFDEEKAETKSSLKDDLTNPMKLLKFVGNGLVSVGKQVEKSMNQQLGGEAPLSKEDEKLAKYVEYLNDVSSQITALASHAQDFVDNQRESTNNLIEMGVNLSVLSQIQQDCVGEAMKSMNDAMALTGQLWNEKSVREESALVKPMRLLAALVDEMRMTVGRRSAILSNYQDAYQGLKKAKANYKKLAATPGKSSKLAGAEDEIDRYKKRAGKLKKKLNTVTEKINGVIEDFRVEKMKLIRGIVLDLLQTEMTYYKQIGNVWKNYVPELSKINMEEALKSANEMAVASVDENRPRNLGADSESEKDSEEDSDSDKSDEESEDSDEDSDEKPKKKSAKKSAKKESSSEEESESESESDSDDDSDDDSDSDDSDDSDDDSDSDSDSDDKKKKSKKSKSSKKGGKKGKKDSSDDSSSD